MNVGKLTPKEYRVLRYVMQGKYFYEICGEMGTSHEMVKYYRKRILKKLKARTMPQAIHHYYEHYTEPIYDVG